ncbi:MAG: hypothetical protein KIT62_07140 [Cyclobacteriaceae bacterium]|nr:hypothetical protein [Cyclobacteriaceae bacterium]
MMLIRKIVSVSLALLVFVASASFTVNMHLCGGQVQSVSFIEKATPCPMEVKMPPCHKEFAKRSSCCNDEQLTYKGQDFKVHDTSSIQIAQSAWVLELPLIAEIVPSSTHAAVHYQPYKPPLLRHDIPVLIQSFLI